MSFDSRSEATKEELNIKKMTKFEKEKFIIKK
jgi:predicted GIY-YIG superfamily endonuclease